MEKHILEDYAQQGLSQRQIAKLENCSQSKIGRWFRKFNLSKQHKNLLFCLVCNIPLKKGETKYCSNKCQGKHKQQMFIQDINTGKRTLNPEQGYQARNYMLLTKEHKCELCGLTTWNGKEIPLILDHIDGNYMNISFTNLRLICPNCDAQLPTFKSRNRGNGRHKRRERYSKGLSY